MDSLHIWRLGIHSLTVHRVRLYGDDLRDVVLINRAASKQCWRSSCRHEGRGALPPAMWAVW